ncbi:uncharacterized protein MYCFIDRAFT_138827 [Pseudocercospora fijiensis CIRAD86]|uniref:ABM domain-containing protein n=1 Tax=Pseudocercospora fijiensis (strain CIRAD86) TaxID=383855 RepID=M2ZSW0_PSEFD|nr:uncharacterized protein MYCFIDRAFT_138827 [Pseudocercospora fijiensis CIRAD86]EME82099.1 hypothetical protein MYCFIDRAFT_138827 [Pseudocercospora fijiensis CIRAD86]
MNPTSNAPVTQIIHLRLPDKTEKPIFEHQRWNEVLESIENAPGFLRVYWGQSLEHPEHVEIHIVRETLQQHHDFLKSKEYRRVRFLIETMVGDAQVPVIRHAQMIDWTPKSRALARGAPFTGTAIYLKTTDAWDEGAWPLWTHIVRYIDGCLGCSGGPLLEPVETFERCYVVYVGWATTEQHHAYHHTKHFAEHAVILRCGNKGFAEYGHIVFQGSREKASSKL